MKICRTIAEIREAVAGMEGSVGLVTTMGALHAGHMALIAAAQADHPNVVATIFVNPTQFGDPADLEKYPRKDAEDLAMLESAGVAAVFLPDVGEMYPPGDETIVETTHLANIFHGEVRPGHYRGVCTVVTKLFNIIGADAAYFGEKDYQQLAVIRRMARDLFMPIAIYGVPTMREADGLAMSSRNARLTPEDRAAAVVLNQSLDAAEVVLGQGGTIEAAAEAIRAVIAGEPRGRLKGLDIVWAESFAAASGAFTKPVGIMISVEFGAEPDTILLIDQREVQP